MAVPVLAERLSVHRSTLAAHARRLELPLQQRGLSVTDAENAAADYLAGATLAELAKRYELSPTTIGRALRGGGIELRSRVRQAGGMK